MLSTNDVLEQRLFGRAGVATGRRRRVEPDWAALARELKRPGVTMMILWEEYRAVRPEGYGYSRYVAAKIMLPFLGRAGETADFPGSNHNIIRVRRGPTSLSRMPSTMAVPFSEVRHSNR